ncbi:MAG TPA: threonine/serine dehydratase [Candidatus Acetothermia bacterium]|nr:threonine/serine dehydratase [Candidatus Acetothermia bacterium]
MKDKLWKEVIDAQERLQGVTHVTPVFESSSLDQIAKSSVTLKAENLQLSGSFKFRGAYNALSALSDEERKRGVITHSSGNHGQALALAAKLLGQRAFVIMPENAPTVKREAVAGYGAMVVPCAPTQSSREEKTREIIEQTSAAFIDSHDDLHVIAGQATAAVELIEQSGPFDILLAPVGGGGLIAGTAIAASHLLDGARVIGCEPAGADDAYKSLATGERILDFTPRTIADGLRTPLGKLNFEIMQQLVDAIVLVSEEEIVRAMRFVWERMKLIIEPSSAVAVAPLLSGAIGGNGERIGVILSGGNVDLDRFFAPIEKTSAGKD